MSILAQSAGPILTQLGGKILGGLFGGGGPNIANKLSKQVGFTVLQKDADLVRARLSAGLDPRTGLPPSGTQQLPTPTPPGVLDRTTGTGEITPNFLTDLLRGVAGGFVKQIEQKLAPITTQAQLTQQQIEAIANRPATGTAPPVALPPVAPLPTFSREVLSTPARAPTPRVIQPTGRPQTMSLLPAVSLSGLPRLAGAVAGRGLVRTTTGRISRIVLPSGQSFSRREAASMIRRFGLDVAATALGIGVVEAAELLLTDSKTRRRRRGITHAQVRNARRTACMVARLARDLGVKPAPARRRTTCRK